MRRVIVECPGTVFPGFVFEPGSGAPAGTWNDDSDATYATGDNATQLPKAFDVPQTSTNVRVYTHIRYSGPDDASAVVAGNQQGFDQVLFTLTGVEGGGPSATPVWMTLEMGGNIQLFLESLFDPTVTSQWLVIGTAATSRLYEAYMTVESPGTVHPLMHYPRADGLAAGGGRQHYPRPNTIQGSNSHYPATL